MNKPSKGISHAAFSEQDLEAGVIAARRGDEMAFALLWRENNSRLTKFVQARTYKSDLDLDLDTTNKISSDYYLPYYEPDDIIIKTYLTSVGVLGIYILYRLGHKLTKQ